MSTNTHNPRLRWKGPHVPEGVAMAFWIGVITAIGMFGFFIVLGAFDPFEAVTGGIVLLVLIVLWTGHAWYTHKHHDEILHDPRMRHARERRGF